MKYICSICGFVYDEDEGLVEEGIAPGTKWEDLPEDFRCPWCGADKAAFKEEKTETEETHLDKQTEVHVEKEMSAMEMSVLCSNLARGCEKQYLLEQAEDFKELANFFKSKAQPIEDKGFEDILKLIEHDLDVALPYAMNVAIIEEDRGANRALTWSTKVTNMLKSLTERYLKVGDAMLENSGVFVCTACGFVYVGDKAPDICPVCKVPSWKFEEVK